ncbi:MAG: hypothetical protein ACKVU2_05010 [Saprospiraceae bacterium]
MDIKRLVQVFSIPAAERNNPGDSWSAKAPVVGTEIGDRPCVLFVGENLRSGYLRQLVEQATTVFHFAPSAEEGLRLQNQLKEKYARVRVVTVLKTPPVEGCFPGIALLDITGGLAEAFDARPGSYFLFGPEGKLVARGRRAEATQIASTLLHNCATCGSLGVFQQPRVTT